MLSEIMEATENKLAPTTEQPAAPAINAGVTTLQTHYTARAAAMKVAYRALAPLDDSARATVFQSLADGSEAGLQADMATFKQRLAKLLGVSASEAATVK